MMEGQCGVSGGRREQRGEENLLNDIMLLSITFSWILDVFYVL